MTTQDITSIVSAIAAAISLALSMIALRESKKTAQEAHRPILDIWWDEDRGHWMLRNVGQSLATGVVVVRRATRPVEINERLRSVPDGDWFGPREVRNLAAGEMVAMEWLNAVNDESIGALYIDGTDTKYTVTCERDRSRVQPGHVLVLKRGEERIPAWVKYQSPKVRVVGDVPAAIGDRSEEEAEGHRDADGGPRKKKA